MANRPRLLARVTLCLQWMIRGQIFRFEEKPGYVRPAWKVNAHTGLPGSFEVV